MQRTYKRFFISDSAWALLEPHLPGREGTWGGVALDNRKFIDGVFWILRTSQPWRNLPSDYGDWKNTHRRFCRWRDNGTWEVLLEQLIYLPDFEWLLVDVTYFSPHSQEESTRDNKKTTEQGKERKKYLWPWMRLICGSEFLLRTVPKRIAPDRSID